MPNQFEIKEINGKQCQFVGDQWYPIKASKKVKKDTSKAKYDTKGKLIIDGKTYTITARPKHFKNSGKNGYTFWLDVGQYLAGNGNVRLNE